MDAWVTLLMASIIGLQGQSKLFFFWGAPLACGLQNTWIVLAANAGGWIENTMIRNCDNNYFSFDEKKEGIPMIILGLWWWLEMWKVDRKMGGFLKNRKMGVARF